MQRPQGDECPVFIEGQALWLVFSCDVEVARLWPHHGSAGQGARVDAFDHRSVGLHESRGGEAEETCPRGEKFAKQWPVHLEHELAAIEIGRREARLAEQRRALAFPKQICRVDRVLHKAASV